MGGVHKYEVIKKAVPYPPYTIVFRYTRLTVYPLQKSKREPLASCKRFVYCARTVLRKNSVIKVRNLAVLNGVFTLNRVALRFSNKIHQIRFFGVKITKKGQYVEIMRFVLKPKISVTFLIHGSKVRIRSVDKFGAITTLFLLILTRDRTVTVP